MNMEASKRTYRKLKKNVKITVKHQLNLSQGYEPEEENSEPLYPVYVTISVNRQFTRFRSRFRKSLTKSSFEEVLGSSEAKDFTDNERVIIEESIKRFNPEQKENFKLTEWSKYYEAGLTDIPSFVENILNLKVYHCLENVYNASFDTIIALPSDLKSKLDVFSLLGMKEAEAILREYDLLLKLRIYESAMQIKFNHYNVYCIWDYRSGFYQIHLQRLLEGQAQPIVNQLDKFFSYEVDIV
jgi:hypothetical protein